MTETWAVAINYSPGAAITSRTEESHREALQFLTSGEGSGRFRVPQRLKATINYALSKQRVQ